MGRELAGHVLAAGHELVVWNRTAAAAASLVQRGARQAATPVQAVAGAEAVVTMLYGPDSVREVIVDSGASFEPGALWVDVTTISPADASCFADWAKGRGLLYAHSPVMGSLPPARAGTLGVILGGDELAVAAARPIVSLWADPERLRVYDSPAKAAAAKLVGNLAVSVAMQGLVEALRLGHSGNLTTEEILVALDKTFLSAIKDLKGENVRTGRFDDTWFSADLLTKDVRLMLDTSRYPLPALTALYESLETARRAGHGEDDFSVVAAPEV
jgi:3-hydroxyisobutyrate dehydrogenase